MNDSLLALLLVATGSIFLGLLIGYGIGITSIHNECYDFKQTSLYGNVYTCTPLEK